jgi:hypothetical protein
MSVYRPLRCLNDDEGQYRVKAWKLATWKSKK